MTELNLVVDNTNNEANEEQALVNLITNRKGTGAPVDYNYVEEGIFALPNPPTNFLKVSLVQTLKIITASEWNNIIRRRRIKEALGRIPSSVHEFVTDYINKNEVKVFYNGTITRKNTPMIAGMVASEDDYEGDVHTFAALKAIQFNDEYNRVQLCRDLRLTNENAGLGYSSQAIEDEVDAFIEKARKERAFILYQTNIAHSSAAKAKADAEWNTFIAAFVDQDQLAADEARAIIQSFMWQVKRKMLTRDVNHHLMPVFTGPQGSGKTSLMKAILAPIHELTTKSDFAQITDPRNIELWDAFVIVLDEMGYASKADVDDVKSLITSEHLTRRPMRTNSTMTIRQRATFIGASNRELSELIRDDTGLRRFADIPTIQRCDWATIDQADMEMLWRSVDENGPNPIIPFLEGLSKRQEEHRNKTNVEMFIEEEVHRLKKHITWKVQALFDAFSEWEKHNQFPPSSKRKFELDMSKLVKSGRFSIKKEKGRDCNTYVFG